MRVVAPGVKRDSINAGGRGKAAGPLGPAAAPLAAASQPDCVQLGQHALLRGV